MKDIRNRIKSVKNTSQITRAMQLVSASKMKRAQNRALASRNYALLLAEFLLSISKQESISKHPLFQQRSIQKKGILVIATDRGLCGALNANLFKLLPEPQESASYITVGQKASQFIARTNRPLLADFPVSDSVPYSEIRSIAEYLLDLYEEKKIDRIEILSNQYITTLTQKPLLSQFLPLTHLSKWIEDIRGTVKVDLRQFDQEDRQFIFEPNSKEILEGLLRLYLKELIYQRILEARASEHSARMVAMKSATDNALKLVDDLTIQYNKARQASITQEILEIAAAAN